MVFENKTKVVPVAAHLQGLFQKKNWQTLWQVYTLSRNWSKIVGSKVARRSAPAYVRKNVLWIQVRDSVWMQHLHTMKPQLLEQVRSAAPELEVNDIRWLLQPAQPEPANATPNKRHEARPPDPEQEKDFARIAATVEDEECRAALSRLWQTFKKFQ